MKIESDYDTGWREGYEAASGAALAESEDSPDEEFIDLLLPLQELRAEVGRLTVELTHRVGWEERCLRAEAEVEHLRAVLKRRVG